MTAHSRFRISAFMLALVAGFSMSMPAAPEQTEHQDRSPILVNTCLISNHVKRLADFYESVLLVKPKWSGEDYVEFPTGAGTLAIFSAAAQEKYIPGSAEGAKNRSAILEFKVANPDKEYRRLQSLVKDWVKPPTTQPWGTRSIYFRDPDGNLVNFYSVVSAR